MKNERKKENIFRSPSFGKKMILRLPKNTKLMLLLMNVPHKICKCWDVMPYPAKKKLPESRIHICLSYQKLTPAQQFTERYQLRPLYTLSQPSAVRWNTIYKKLITILVKYSFCVTKAYDNQNNTQKLLSLKLFFP